MIRDKEEYLIKLRVNLSRRHKTLNIYTPNTASKYVKQKPTEPKGEIDKSTVIAEYFNYTQLLMVGSKKM